MPLAPTMLWLLAGIVFAAFVVETAAGFGSTVVAVTVGALWFSVPELLGFVVPVNMVLSAYLVVRGRGALEWRFLLTRMLPVMAAGLVVGALVAHRLDAAWLKPAFAVFVVALAGWQLSMALGAAQTLTPLRPGWRTGALVGAGVIHGVFATGGPLAVFVAARELGGKASFRATLSALWFLLNALLLPRLVVDGVLSGASLTVSAVLVVPLVMGVVVGEVVHARLDERRFRVVVAVLLILAGLVLLVGSLFR